jgi:hypothetical protein
MTRSREGEPEVRLEVYKTSDTTTAWRVEEPEAPGMFAIIADGTGNRVPVDPEVDDMILALFDDQVPETLGSVEIDGRAGLNRWYELNVGFRPDDEGDGPLPIQELIQNVAHHLLLRYYGDTKEERELARATVSSSSAP